MSARLDYRKAAPQAIDALAGINRYLDGASIERPLRLLLEIRISQINGCVYCVDLHTREARSGGETPRRLDCLCLWRETALFDARERAALALAEALTLSAQSPDTEAAYAEARAQFDDRGLVDLALVIAGMNAWNRIGVAFRPALRGA